MSYSNIPDGVDDPADIPDDDEEDFEDYSEDDEPTYVEDSNWEDRLETIWYPGPK
jgi:hypothetical protein